MARNPLHIAKDMGSLRYTKFAKSALQYRIGRGHAAEEG